MFRYEYSIALIMKTHMTAVFFFLIALLACSNASTNNNQVRSNEIPGKKIAAAAQQNVVNETAAGAITDVAESEILTQDKAKVLLQKSGCTACHAVDKTLIGPAYKEVALHYADPKKVSYLNGQDPLVYLMAKVRSGTKADNRHWTTSKEGRKYGVMTPMSAGRVSDENLEKLIRYILSLK